MRVLDNEGEVVVKLSNVDSGQALDKLFNEMFTSEENEVLGDIPFLGYNEIDNPSDFEWVDVDYFDKEMTVEEWFVDLKSFVNSCLTES